MPAPAQVLFTAGGTLFQCTGDKNGHPYYEPLGTENTFTISLQRRDAAPQAAAGRRSSAGDGVTQYVIVVVEDEEVVFEQPIKAELQLSYSTPAASVHWPAMVDGERETIAFRFAAASKAPAAKSAQTRMESFVELYNRCLYSLLAGSDDVDPEDEWFQYLDGTTTHELRNEDSTEAVFELDARQLSMANTGTGNVCAAESMKFNRVLVVKKTNEEASLELQAMPQTQHGFDRTTKETLVVRGVDGTATGTLLENGDTNMLLFGGRRAAVQQLDLSRGTVVQDFEPASMSVKSVAYANHTAADSGAVYTCLARNVAFNIDTRIDPRSCVIVEEGKNPTDYALSSLRADFTCHATSKVGHLAIGDSLGSIRLYTGPPGARKLTGGYFPKSAKTLLETKTPILDIDVSTDGQYIVATSAAYLLFIETKYVDAKEKDTTGFEGRMGKKKPQPIILRPSPEQMTAMAKTGTAGTGRFRSAKFDRIPGSKELYVTASYGDCLFSWSLRSIESSKETGRAAISSHAAVGQTVLSTNANRASQVSFLTDTDVGTVPLFEVNKSVSRAWTWGTK
ncbi:VID27 cytoplasmic protein [Novymonas esmeraldas]|uniref:VID27 cytoplasmic protein n=1 Tax=Novymonas esmeraldas TaxID=1808958 RepID=A0AAW0EX71_9TRYP